MRYSAYIQYFKQIFTTLILCLIGTGLHAQNKDEFYVKKYKSESDSAVFFDIDSVAMHYNMYLDGELYFKNFKVASQSRPESDNDCVQPLLQNIYGSVNFIFKGSTFEVSPNTSLKGNYYFSFDNDAVQQTIYFDNTVTGVSEPTLKFSNVQINSARGVQINNVAMQVSNNLSLKKGVVFLRNRNLDLDPSASITCYSNSSTSILVKERISQNQK